MLIRIFPSLIHRSHTLGRVEFDFCSGNDFGYNSRCFRTRGVVGSSPRAGFETIDDAEAGKLPAATSGEN